jgi:hypothetical protein
MYAARRSAQIARFNFECHLEPRERSASSRFTRMLTERALMAHPQQTYKSRR